MSAHVSSREALELAEVRTSTLIAVDRVLVDDRVPEPSSREARVQPVTYGLGCSSPSTQASDACSCYGVAEQQDTRARRHAVAVALVDTGARGVVGVRRSRSVGLGVDPVHRSAGSSTPSKNRVTREAVDETKARTLENAS